MHTQLRFLTTLPCGLCTALAAPAMQLAEGAGDKESFDGLFKNQSVLMG